MKKLHFAALVFASSIPAYAYANTPPEAAPAAPTGAAQSTAPTGAAQSTAPAESATSAPATSATAAPTSIEQIVSTDFPTYDADKSGELNKSEFSSWMVAAKAQSGATAPDKTWLTDAFAKADADKSKTVSAVELTKFLSA
jgi:hypothetical protein